MNDQTDSDFIFDALLLHLLHQNHLLDTIHGEYKIDAEKFKKKVIIVFTQIDFNNSSENGVFSNRNFLTYHAYFSNPEKFEHKTATFYSLLELDVDDEFSAQNETLQINYASSDYPTSWSATLPRTDAPAMLKKFNHDPIRINLTFAHNDFHSPQKNETTKSHLLNISSISLGKIKRFKEQLCLQLFLT